MKLENATVQAVNLSTLHGMKATVTLTIENPTDDDLAALLSLANKPVSGTLETRQHTQPAG
jgi:hypothetical protein